MKNTRSFLFFATLLFCRSLFASDSAGSKTEGRACCQEKPVAKVEKKTCCAHDNSTTPASIVNQKAESAHFSSDSLYQLDAAFTADSGQPFSLGELRGRPVVLTMFFGSCGYACPLIVSDMQAIRAKLPAEIRDRAAFVLISFDVLRDTPAALATYRSQRGLDSQWTLLHGTDDSVREIAALLGVKFRQEADGAFSHSNLVTILNAQGEIVHQRTGLQGGLDEAAAAIR